MLSENVGNHLIADFYGVEASLLQNERKLMRLLHTALEQARFTIINCVSHKFADLGAGVTGVFLLSESHAAFHTYPEFGYMSFDVFSCGKSEPEQVLKLISSILKPQTTKITTILRGDYCGFEQIHQANRIVSCY